MENPQLFSQIKGKRVALHGQSETVKVQPHFGVPERTVTVPPATQSDLEFLFKEGNPIIEFYEEEKSAVKADAVKS